MNTRIFTTVTVMGIGQLRVEVNYYDLDLGYSGALSLDFVDNYKDSATFTAALDAAVLDAVAQDTKLNPPVKGVPSQNPFLAQDITAI